MGATIGSFLGGVQRTFGAKLKERHDQEEQQKEEKRQALYKLIFDPNTSAGGREYANSELQKLYNPEAKKGLKKVGPYIEKLIGLGGQKQPQPTGPPQASYDQDRLRKVMDARGPEAAGWQSPERTVPQGPDFSRAMQGYGYERAAAAQKQKLDLEQSEYDAWLKRGKDLGLKERDLAEYAGSKGAKLPPQQKRVADKGVARPGEDPSNGKPYEGLWDHTVDAEGAETWAKRPDVTAKGSGFVRSVPHSVSVNDAKSLKQQGQVYKNQAGEEIDLEKVPPNMGLQAMVQGDKMFWIPISPTQKTITVGNEVYAVNPYNMDVAHGGGIAQGPARVGSASTGQTPVYNPDTRQFEMFTTHRTSTPTTPGAGSGASPQSRPQPAPRPAPAAPPTAGGMGSRIPAGQYRGIVEKAIPVQEATTQIFGDPSQPDLKGLKDYVKLADDPKSRERLGKALRLTFDGLNQTTGGAHISAEAGPVSVSTGGIGAVLQNYFGVPQKLAEQQSSIMQGAIKDLTPEEREYYDSVMSSFSTIVGLRSLTRASAAQASVNAIERELPVIGVNTVDSKQFADQLQRLSEVIVNGVRNLPQGAMDSKLTQRINGLPSEMQRLKRGTGPAKAPGQSDRPRAINPKTGATVEWDGKAWVPVRP